MVDIKIINQSDHAIRMRLNGEEVVFGLVTRPIVYCSVPAGETNNFEFESITDIETLNSTDFETCAKIGSSFVSFSRGALRANKLAKRVKDSEEYFEACRTVVSGLKGWKMFDNIPKEDQISLIKQLKESREVSDSFKLASNATKFSVANLGLSGIEWYCSRDVNSRRNISLKINDIEGYSKGKEALIRVTNKEVFHGLRDIPDNYRTIRCSISSETSREVICSYNDNDGDDIQILIEGRFNTGEIEVRADNNIIALQDAPRPKNSTFRHSVVLARGICSGALAFCDPFPLTKILSATSAGNDLCIAKNGICKRSFISNLNPTQDTNIRIFDRDSTATDVEFNEM